MHCECDMSILRVRAINWRIVIVNDIQFKKTMDYSIEEDFFSSHRFQLSSRWP